RDKVCFLSSNCWDAHGAAYYGFKTLWVNRGGLPEDNLPGKVVGHLKDLSALPDQLGVAQ
ncbi:MAG: haloacid dehalogenase, partial [Proteobacteria bacterium]|nr:haloacid dehalogenase [Pseudomonadota bacterium]